MKPQVNTRPSMANKVRARILTVDVRQRRIEAGIRDGTVTVVVTETGPFFKWPKQEELWSIVKEGDTWRLDRLLEEEAVIPIEALVPGDAKISADVIYTESGYTLVRDDQLQVLIDQLNDLEARVEALEP